MSLIGYSQATIDAFEEEIVGLHEEIAKLNHRLDEERAAVAVLRNKLAAYQEFVADVKEALDELEQR